jgi:hypothetical protein
MYAALRYIQYHAKRFIRLESPHQELVYAVLTLVSHTKNFTSSCLISRSGLGLFKLFHDKDWTSNIHMISWNDGSERQASYPGATVILIL